MPHKTAARIHKTAAAGIIVKENEMGGRFVLMESRTRVCEYGYRRLGDLRKFCMQSIGKEPTFPPHPSTESAPLMKTAVAPMIWEQPKVDKLRATWIAVSNMALLVVSSFQSALGIAAPFPGRSNVAAKPKLAQMPAGGGDRALSTFSREVEGSLLRYERSQRRGMQLLSPPGTVPVNPTVATSILSEMGLADFEPLLQKLPAGLVAGAAGPAEATDLRNFVRTVRGQASSNPLLCELAHALTTADADAEGRAGGRAHSLPPIDDRTMYELVHYTLLLDRLTRALATEPSLAADVYAQLRETVHSTPNWRRGLGLFELAKLMTVEMTLERFIDHRKNANLPSNFGHIGLPFNIFEAVLQDLKLGFHTNALAGLALCLARPGQSAGPDRPGVGASLSPDARRAVRMYLPLEQQWKDLYVSWNLAFTTTYADAPTRFGAPLLAPVVLGATPEEFMFHRVLALHLHICLFILRRARAFDELDGAAG